MELDRYLANVQEFHLAFGIPMQARPAFYEGTPNYHAFILQPYVTALAQLGQELRAEAKNLNELGSTSLGRLVTRLQLHVEETAELAEAFLERDMVAALDALTDIDYVTNGTHLVIGTTELRQEAHDIVHDSNMSKLGLDGAPIVDMSGRVVKGPNYKDPKERLKALVERAL